MPGMVFTLTGRDDLSRVLDGAGDNAAQMARRIDDAARHSNASMARFTRDTNGRLRDLNGRFVSAGSVAGTLTGTLGDMTSQLGLVSSAGSDAAVSLGRSSGGVGGAMAAVAAIAGLSLLPALGALVPLMAGAALAAGTLKLGFAGVSDALAAAGQGQEEYQEALKKLSPEARAFTKEVVSLKKEFSGVGKEVQKAMLPGFTKALKDARPVVDILADSMTEMAGAFGDAAAGAGRMMKDAGFQGALQTNLKLGSEAIRDITGSLGPFTRSLLDFGAASGPTLKSITDGLSGLLSKGLPGMFDGLKDGIGGSAAFIDGLFDSINNVLPSVGRFAGAVAEAFGPLFGEGFRVGGSIVSGTLDGMARALKIVEPVTRDVAFGLKTIMDVGRIVSPTLSDIGAALSGAFSSAGQSVDKAVGPLQRLNLWVRDNKMQVMEMARVFGHSTISMVNAALQATPFIIRAFAIAANAILLSLGGIAHGAVAAFSWIPGIGDKIKSASNKFDGFRKDFVGSLDKAAVRADTFAAEVRPKLASGQLKLDINNWNAQIKEAKARLTTVPPSRQAALKATISDLERKVAAARGKLNSIDGKTANTYVVTHYQRKDGASFLGPSGRYASGGLVGFPGGGPVRGPGTGTSDSVPILASNGEYVINAKSTAKHRSLIEAINKDSLGAGPGMAGAGSAVAAGLASGMTAATGLVGSAARMMAAAVTSGIKDELQIASPSKKTRSLAKDVGKGFISGLTGSRDKIKSVAADLAKDIKTAFTGRKESSLLRMVDKQTKRLLDAAAKRDAIAKKIADAKAYASGVTSTAREQASLSSLGMEPEQVTAGRIKGGLAQKLAKLKQFSRFISVLAKRGLNKGLIRQILNMGPEQGYAYANALAGADKATLASINKTQGLIDSESKKLGSKGADILYDSGKNASKGFLAGLQSQQKSIEKYMLAIAKSMQKAIKKALGIRSPSTVMAQLGAYSTEGLARGLVDGMPVLDRALGAVSGRVSGIQPVLGRAAVASRGVGGAVIHIHVDGAVVDNLGFARAAREALLELKRAHGFAELGIA